MGYIKIRQSIYLIIAMTVCVLLFQNCSKVKFSQAQNLNMQTSLDVSGGVAHDKTVQISATPNKVDFLLVIDDSGSMEDDVLELARKLSGFLTNLNSSQVDWQMCMITTNDFTLGKSYSWSTGNSGIILNSQSGDTSAIILNTLQDLFKANYFNGDERGIKQAYLHMQDVNNSSCYRAGAVFVPIFISDEDERSTGDTDYSYLGDEYITYNKPTGPIEDIDRPANYLAEFNKHFINKKIQAHSIVIKSNDAQCFDEQAGYSDVSFGKFYETLSNLTSGTITSICEEDYSKNLSQISAHVVSLSQNLQMDCSPIATPEVLVFPNDPDVRYKILDQQVFLVYPSNKAYTVKLNYVCN